jgi:hypothetical protein
VLQEPKGHKERTRELKEPLVIQELRGLQVLKEELQVLKEQ